MDRARRMMVEYHDRLPRMEQLHPDVALIGGDARALGHDRWRGRPRVHLSAVLLGDRLHPRPPVRRCLDGRCALDITVDAYRLLGRDYVGSERARSPKQASSSQPRPRPA